MTSEAIYRKDVALSFAVGIQGVFNATRGGWDWQAKYDTTNF